MIRLFVYGTLKQGFRNHHYCQSGEFAGNAFLPGKLYDLPAGYPALTIMDKQILAEASENLFDDIKLQSLLEKHLKQEDKFPSASQKVYGELYEFSAPATEMKEIDYLEGFDPKGARDENFYSRVLLPVDTGKIKTLAWTYVMNEPVEGELLSAGKYI